MEEEKKYLIGVCAHINTQEKFKQLIEQLEYLREEKLDVCLSINSKEHLSELTNYVKYIIYDSDNEFIDQPFYLENAEICHNNHGRIMYSYGNSSFSANYSVPFHGHSKPAFKLWANSFYTSWQNGYEWICHTEYDVKKPLMGWKKYFEDIIKNLEDEGKKAFYYYENGAIWGNCFVLSSNICESPLLLGARKINTKKDWIKYWGTGVAETCLNSIIDEKFGGMTIIRSARDSVKDIWGISNPSEIHQSSKVIFEDGFNHLLINKNEPDVVHIYPSKNDSEYELCLLLSCNTCSSTQTEILNTIVKYDENIIYENAYLYLSNGYFSLIDLPDYNGVKCVTLSYEKKVKEKILTYTESFLTENICHIWRHIMSLTKNI
jgi:hypothetical protein